MLTHIYLTSQRDFFPQEVGGARLVYYPSENAFWTEKEEGGDYLTLRRKKIIQIIRPWSVLLTDEVGPVLHDWSGVMKSKHELQESLRKDRTMGMTPFPTVITSGSDVLNKINTIPRVTMDEMASTKQVADTDTVIRQLFPALKDS